MLTYPDFKEKQIVICFASKDNKLNFQNDNLILKDENDKIILQNSCYKTFALWIVGSTTISSGIMERSKKFGFGIQLFNYSFKQYGCWNAEVEGNFLLRSVQYKTSSIESAKRIIQNKILNQCQLVNTIRGKTAFQKDTVVNLRKYLLDINNRTSIQEIMGLEGIASKVFFEAWFADIGWQGRQPRAKRDILNVLLDIGYTFLFNIVEAMLHLYGFDVYKGVLHQTFYQRKSLVCDIVEPFRVIIDHQLKIAWNLGQIKKDDFQVSKGQYILEYKNSKQYTKLLMNSILSYKQDIFIYVQNYYRWVIKDKGIEDFPQFIFKNND